MWHSPLIEAEVSCAVSGSSMARLLCKDCFAKTVKWPIRSSLWPPRTARTAIYTANNLMCPRGTALAASHHRSSFLEGEARSPGACGAPAGCHWGSRGRTYTREPATKGVGSGVNISVESCRCHTAIFASGSGGQSHVHCRKVWV